MQAGRTEQAVEIEVHPGNDEVDRDQEAEPDPLQPHPHGLPFRGVEGQPDEQACGERAEHEVEADFLGEQHERREQ